MITIQPLYTYDKVGSSWNIYQMTYIGTSSYGEKVDWFPTKQEAETEVYRLNGWTPKTSKIK